MFTFYKLLHLSKYSLAQKLNKIHNNNVFSMRFTPLFADQVLVVAVELVVFTVAVVHSVNLTIVVEVSVSHPFI